MANENNQQRKSYTFLNTYKVVSPKGGEQDGVTLIGYVSNVKPAQNESAPTHASVAIKNRAKRINMLLGTNFPENEETIFADLAVWRDAGKRLEKYMAVSPDRKSVKAVLVGRIRKNEFTRKDGTPGVSVVIDVNDWESVDYRSANGGNSGTQQAAPQTVGTSSGGFSEIDPAEMENEDCPF